MGLLTIETKAGDDQKLYLPALRRVQRIAGSKKSERFAGSDFSYADLGTRRADDYTSTLLETQPECWKIEAIPTDEDLSYSRVIFEIEQERYVILRATYYDQNGKLWKAFTAKIFRNQARNVAGHKMTMEDLQEKRRTILIFRKRDTDADLSEQMFTERQLKRGL